MYVHKPKYQYKTHFFDKKEQYQNPRTNRYSREIRYQGQTHPNRNIAPSPDVYDYDNRRLEISSDEINPQNMYKSRSIIRSIRDNINDEKFTTSQLAGNKPLSSALHNFSSRFGEEREPSPKTINIGDTKETIEYNIRTLNARKSPRYYEEMYPPQEMNYLESNESEPRNGNLDGRKYYGQNTSNIERGPNIIVNRYNDNNASMNVIDRNGFIISGNNYIGRYGGRVAIGGQGSPYQNYEEMNTSNDFERSGSEDRKNRTYMDNTSYDYRQNSFDNVNKMPQNRPANINNIDNNYNLKNYNNNIKRMNLNNINVNMTQYPVNTITMQKDDIQEKYVNKTYDNMTYKDVKKIVRRFTKVYDPNKNNNGLLIEQSQITLPGANDDIFNNRYKVLTKMNRLSNILLSKQRRPSPRRPEDDFLYNYNSYDEMSAEHSDEYNIRTNKSFNRQSFEKKAKSPLKLPHRKSPENKFKYVSLAMISSKGLRTEDRVILRKMRFEKGGVVDLAQEEKRRGKYKIRKVSRSPGYKKNFYRTNPKYREKAARYIQSWWKEMKDLYKKKIEKIIKIQSVYRGRFVRKYLYDLLYLNYLYLSFCQKIEKVLKQEIKPYIFNILKEYGKKREFSEDEDEKDYNKLKNIVASKANKWRIINLRRCFDKWKKFFRNKEKLTLIIYKLLKLRVEKNNRKSILRDALRKWNYSVKKEEMLEKFEEEKNNILKTTQVKTVTTTTVNIEEEKEKLEKAKDDQSNKIKGLFKLLGGINSYTKKAALEPTLPKLTNYLLNERLKKLLIKIITRKIIDDKEKLKHYFYKYIKMTLKYMKNRINDLPQEIQEQDHLVIPQIEPFTKKVKEQQIQILRKHKPVVDPKAPTIPKTSKMSQTDVTDYGVKVIKIKEEDSSKKEENERLKKLIDEQENKKNKEILLMKTRIFLHLIKCVKDKQNKNILRKYFTKYFKKVIQLQREEDRKNFEEQQKKERQIREKEREIEREKEKQREKERKDEKEKDRLREKERKDEEKRERQRERERQAEKEKEKQWEKEIQDEKDKNKEKDKEIEKDKQEINKYKETIEKYKITTTTTTKKEIITTEQTEDEKEIYRKCNEDLLNKLRSYESLRRFTLRNVHKYPFKA